MAQQIAAPSSTIGPVVSVKPDIGQVTASNATRNESSVAAVTAAAPSQATSAASVTTVLTSMASTLSTLATSPGPTERLNSTVTDKAIPAIIHDDGHSSLMQTFLIPLTLVCIVGVILGIVFTVLRKNRLDKLRHHLMPVYNFDPGDGEDWETELLEDNLIAAPVYGDSNAMPLGGLKGLKLDTGLTGGLRIKPLGHDGATKTGSPTPSSGLLSSASGSAGGGMMNGNSRQLYTSERNPTV